MSNGIICATLFSEKRKAVKDFCFPEGVRIVELKPTDSMSEALRYFVVSNNGTAFCMVAAQIRGTKTPLSSP